MATIIYDRTAAKIYTVTMTARLATVLLNEADGPLGELFTADGHGLTWERLGSGDYRITGALHHLDTLALRVRVWVRRAYEGRHGPHGALIRHDAGVFNKRVADLFLRVAAGDADRIARSGVKK